MLLKEPLCLRWPALLLPSPVPVLSAPSLLGESAALFPGDSESSWLRARDHLSCRGEVGDSIGAPAGVVLPGGAPRRKMWTVSDVEEMQRRVELRLNDML